MSKLQRLINSKVVSSSDVRIVLVLLTLVLFVLGAGAPSDAGGIAGF